MTSQDATTREPGTTYCSMSLHGLQSVGRTGRMVAAHLAVQRADGKPICLQHPDQESLDRIAHHSPHARAGESSVEVVRQGRRPSSVRCRKSAHHDPRPLGQPIQTLSHQVTQLALDPVALDGRSDGLAHDETDGRVPAGSWNASVEQDVGDESRLCTFGATTDREPEVLPAAHALTAREQRIRRTAWRDPCGDGPRGSLGRRGCACGGGSRASWHDDGCSAGKYACSRCCP